MLNSSLHTASTAVSTHGRYSGRQPAITAAIATFSTVTSTRSGGTVATTSSGARVVPVSMRSTRSSVGGTTGRPSVQPRLEHQLELVLGVGDVDPARAQHVAVVDGAQLVDAIGVDAHRAAARSHRRQVEAQPEDPGEVFPLGAQPPDRARDLLSRSRRGSASARSRSRGASSRARSASWIARGRSGKSGSSCVYTVSVSIVVRAGASTGTTMRHVSHSRFTTTTSPSGSVGVPIAATVSPDVPRARTWAARPIPARGGGARIRSVLGACRPRPHPTAPPRSRPTTCRCTRRDWLALALARADLGIELLPHRRGARRVLAVPRHLAPARVRPRRHRRRARDPPAGAAQHAGRVSRTLGVVWMAVPLSLFPFAEQRVSSSVTGMLNGATPVFTAVVAAVLVRGLPPARQLLGLCIGVVGIVLIASPSWSEGSSSASGVVMILAGARVLRRGAEPRGAAAAPARWAARDRPHACWSRWRWSRRSASPPSTTRRSRWRSALAVAALGAFGTGLAYVLMASNAGRYGSTRAASTTYLIPGVSLALGLAFRGESVHAIAIVGSVVALAGAYLVNTGVRKQPVTPRS